MGMRMNRRSRAWGFLLGLTLVAIQPAHAELLGFEAPRLAKPEEGVSPLPASSFGEHVSLYDGTTIFRVVDISVPGAGPEVALARTFSVSDRHEEGFLGGFGEWDLDVPRLETLVTDAYGWTVGSGSNSRCSQGPAPRSIASFPAQEFWSGISLRVGGQSQSLLTPRPGLQAPTRGGPYRYTTTAGWFFRCLPAAKNGLPGEAFEAVSPDGTRYRFDWYATRQAPRLKKATNISASFDDSIGDLGQPFPDNPTLGGTTIQANVGSILGQYFAASNMIPPMENPAHPPGSLRAPQWMTLARKKVFLLATRVEDRFGNWVDYSYDAEGRLLSIRAKDGRLISLGQSGGRISSATAGDETWTYSYHGSGWLDRVTRPDGMYWQYGSSGSLDRIKAAPVEVSLGLEEPGVCDEPVQLAPLSFGYTVRHPAGAVASYEFKTRDNSLSQVPMVCVYNHPADNYYFIPPTYETFSILQKRVTGAGLDPMTWRYEYEDRGFSWLYWCPPNSTTEVCRTRTERRVSVIQPDDSRQRHTFGTRFNVDEGQLKQTEVIEDDRVLEVREYTYLTEEAATSMGLSPRVGQGFSRARGIYHGTRQPQRSRTIWRQGESFTTETVSFDGFLLPEVVNERSSVGYERSFRTIYEHDYENWVIGLPAIREDLVLGRETSRTIYDQRSLPVELFEHSQPSLSVGYHADGQVAWTLDPLGRLTKFEDWRRGQPRRVIRPDGKAESRQISELGYVLSSTDVLGETTRFEYEPGGILSRVVPPSGDGVRWAETQISIEKSSATADDLAAGHWVQTVSRGNYRKVTLLDSLLRRVRETEFDLASRNETERTVRYSYDYQGRLIFNSFPSSQPSHVAGVRTKYDALGRTESVVGDSELGPISTYFGYEEGLRTRIVGPRGFSTLVEFQAFSDPDESAQVRIREAVGTPSERLSEFHRDHLGKVLELRRNAPSSQIGESVQRRYAYDEKGRICKSWEPETGATITGYDQAGQVAWTASGVDAPEGGCDQAIVEDSEKTFFEYDQLGYLIRTVYPSGSEEVRTTYLSNGLVSSIESGDYTNSYEYNNLGLLVHESVVGPSLNFSLRRSYSELGHIESAEISGDENIEYGPNALGQPTRVGNLISGITYFPNGEVAGYFSSDGTVSRRTQNTRQLPAAYEIEFSNGANRREVVEYDMSGNPVVVHSFGLNGGREERLYDPLDRLVAVSDAERESSNTIYSYDTFENRLLVEDWRGYVRADINGLNQLEKLSLSQSPAPGEVQLVVSSDPHGRVSRFGNDAYSFDGAGRLTEASRGIRFEYDGAGNRVRKVGTGSHRDFFYSRDGALASWVDSNDQSKVFLYYVKGELVARKTSTAAGEVKVNYSHFAASGSPVFDTNGTGGPVKTRNWGPFGGARDSLGIEGPGYRGHYHDSETGLIYMLGRYYDPRSGRFISPDPVPTDQETGASFSRFSYASSNPFRFSDKTGRYTTAEWIDAYATQAADEQRHVAGFGWTYAGVAWDFLGAEGVSRVWDDPAAAGGGSLLLAAIEVGTLGKGSAIGKAGKGAVSALSRTSAYSELMAIAAKLDVKTALNGAVFYSGKGNRELAERFARENGKMTLEMTPGGAWLDSLNLWRVGGPLTPDQARAVWSVVSARFAKESQGVVVGFVDGAKSYGVFRTVELPILLSNPAIRNIITGGK